MSKPCNCEYMHGVFAFQVKALAKDIYEKYFVAAQATPRGVVAQLCSIVAQLQRACEKHSSQTKVLELTHVTTQHFALWLCYRTIPCCVRVCRRIAASQIGSRKWRLRSTSFSTSFKTIMLSLRTSCRAVDSCRPSSPPSMSVSNTSRENLLDHLSYFRMFFRTTKSRTRS